MTRWNYHNREPLAGWAALSIMQIFRLSIFAVSLIGLLAAGCAVPPQNDDRLLSFKDARAGATYESGVYVIAPGDSVASICKHFDLLIPDFMTMNPGLNPRRLVVGQTVKVYERLKP